MIAFSLILFSLMDLVDSSTSVCQDAIIASLHVIAADDSRSLVTTRKDKGTYGFWASCCSNTTVSTTTNFRIQVYNVHTLSIGTVWGFRCVSLVGQRRFNENPSYHIKPSYWSHIYGTLRPRSCRYGELTSCNHSTDFFSLPILRSR
jgi:hypothetical protein